MTEPGKHHIDLQKLEQVGQVGVRRAALFMGLGLNAAHRDDFNEYRLRSLPRTPGQLTVPIEFFPEDLPAEKVKDFKDEYATWTIACGLREVIEHYAQLLDQIFAHGLIVLQFKKGKLPFTTSPQTRVSAFGRLGVPDKFKELSTILGINIEGSASASELYIARNALTHDLGHVTAKRAPSGKLEISWVGFDVIGIGKETGKEYSISDLEGKRTPEEIGIQARTVRRQKEFKVGTSIRLTSQDLSEICSYFSMVLIKSAIQEFGVFLKANGVGA